ncbi:MAG TPA: hypothetical protein PK239_17930 [Chitinophagales bacterium]|nr:hypothetical protein [Chitinophagales bacterium]
MRELQKILREKGYLNVALPQTGIAPLQMVIKEQGAAKSLGNITLDAFFKPDISAPPGIQKEQAIEISGSLTSAVEDQAELSILEQLLSRFGIGKIKSGFSLQLGTVIEFSFNNPQKETIALLDLDNFLTGAIFQEGNFNTYEERLKRGDLYVITDVLKSDEISITVKSGSNVGAGATLTLENVIDFNANIDHSTTNTSSMTHKRKGEMLVFGFKAVIINYDKPGWFSSKKKPRFTLKQNLNDVTLRGNELDLNPLWLDTDKTDFGFED